MDFLIEMAWKSALISGGALLIMLLLRSKAPSDRAAVLRLGLVMLFLLPAIAAVLPALEVETGAAPEIVQPFAYSPEAPASPADAPASYSLAAPAAAEAATWDDPTPLVRLAWIAGVLMIGMRLLGGLWTLRRWTARAEEVSCPHWLAALDRARAEAGLARSPRLLVTSDCPAPLSWGWFSPAILIDPESLRDREAAESILAHEVAHIARRDWPVLMLARATVALFWFNPLVWLLEKECIQQAEEAADSHALRQVEPTRYAQTLLSCAQCSSLLPLPANRAAADSGLGRRVKAILDGRLHGRSAGSFAAVAAMAGCFAFAAPVSALKLVEAVAPEAEAPAVPLAPPAVPAALAAAPIAPLAPATPVAPTLASFASVASPAALAPPALAGPAPLPVASAVAVSLQSMAAPMPPAPPAPAAAPRPPLDPDTLVQLRIHGVNARFIREMAAAAPQLRALRPDQLVAMKIHGVSPAFAREAAASGLKVTADSLVAMKIHGISARAVAEARGHADERSLEAVERAREAAERVRELDEEANDRAREKRGRDQEAKERLREQREREREAQQRLREQNERD
jgi:beta-lactamase regulating signal transducer with metallopeptidase domain